MRDVDSEFRFHHFGESERGERPFPPTLYDTVTHTCVPNDQIERFGVQMPKITVEITCYRQLVTQRLPGTSETAHKIGSWES